MELLELILVLATVTGIVGETIVVKDNAGKPIVVKLACINTEFRTQQRHSLITSRLNKLIPIGSPVVIRSIEMSESARASVPGEYRMVGEVYVDNRSVNLRLVEEGSAVVNRESLHNCSESKTQFLIAEANAKNKRLGLWQQSSNSVNKPKIYSWRGKLIYEKISPAKSPRAYQGDEFFLIANPDSSRFVLRPSKTVSHAQLQSFHNQQVEITAVHVEGTRPSPNKVACPVDTNGQCMPQSDGYQVLSIVLLKPLP
jgi:endonuclease YncB( thermonuclease family)